MISHCCIFLFTGAPIIVHTPCNEKATFEILDVLEEVGGDATRTVFSHLDRTFFDNDALLGFAKRGCYMEFDMFGLEISHYSVSTMIELFQGLFVSFLTQ